MSRHLNRLPSIDLDTLPPVQRTEIDETLDRLESVLVDELEVGRSIALVMTGMLAGHAMVAEEGWTVARVMSDDRCLLFRADEPEDDEGGRCIVVAADDPGLLDSRLLYRLERARAVS